MLKAPQRRLWWSCPHTDHLVVLRAQWSAAPPLVAQKAAAAEPSIRHRRWRLRAPSAHLGAAGAGRRQQALEAPNQPSRCFTGPVYRAASAPVRAHGCGEAAAHQPPRRCGSQVFLFSEIQRASLLRLPCIGSILGELPESSRRYRPLLSLCGTHRTRKSRKVSEI